MRARAAIAVLFLAAASGASAGSAPSGDATASEASVRELLALMDVKAQMENAMAQVKSVMRQQMQQGFKQGIEAASKSVGDPAILAAAEDPELLAISEGFMDKLSDLITAELEVDQLIDDMAGIYGSVYSEAEVRALIDFYGSPIGRKLVARQPEVLQKSMQLMQGRMPEMQQKMIGLMTDYMAQVKELAERRKRERKP